MNHVVIVGGGAALAQPLLQLWRTREYRITAVVRYRLPNYNIVGSYKEITIIPFQTKSGDMGLTPYVVGGGIFSLDTIDLLVTMPSKVRNGKIESMTDGEWDEVLQTNLTDVFKSLQQCLPSMKNNSNVVVVGSIVGSIGGYGCANYAAAKAGLVGLVRATANEVASRGICVNLLELGYINAGMGARLDPKIRAKVEPTIPLKHFGTEDDFVLAVDFLSKTRYMTGGVLTVAGGLR